MFLTTYPQIWSVGSVDLPEELSFSSYPSKVPVGKVDFSKCYLTFLGQFRAEN